MRHATIQLPQRYDIVLIIIGATLLGAYIITCMGSHISSYHKFLNKQEEHSKRKAQMTINQNHRNSLFF